MKLLIIGDIASQFIENFSLSLKDYDNLIEIDIVNPTSINDVKYKEGRPYKKIYSYQPLNPVIAKIPKLRGILTNRKINKIIGWLNQDHRNKHHAKADWQFTTANARVKLKRLYPQFE